MYLPQVNVGTPSYCTVPQAITTQVTLPPADIVLASYCISSYYTQAIAFRVSVRQVIVGTYPKFLPNRTKSTIQTCRKSKNNSRYWRARCYHNS